jgi:ferrous iron transport protein B
MELPGYKWPSARTVFHRVYDRGRAFVVRAGTLIFATTILVWAAAYFPGDHSELESLETQLETLQTDDPNAASEGGEPLRTQINQLRGDLLAGSMLGRLGHAIEPAIKPLGWDWKIGIGAIASFPAREVIIATLGTIYSLGGDVAEDDQGLVASMQASVWPDGSKVYNVPVALSIMVFFALCAQCAATLMIIKRETNSWGWPLFTFVYMTALAYAGAFVTYQVGMLFT